MGSMSAVVVLRVYVLKNKKPVWKRRNLVFIVDVLLVVTRSTSADGICRVKQVVE